MHRNLQLLPFDVQPSSFIAGSQHWMGYQRKNTCEYMSLLWWWGTRSNHHKIESHQDEDASDIRDGPPGKMGSRGRPTNWCRGGPTQTGPTKCPWYIHQAISHLISLLSKKPLWHCLLKVMNKHCPPERASNLINGPLNALFSITFNPC